MKISANLAEIQRSAALTLVLINYTRSHYYGDSSFKVEETGQSSTWPEDKAFGMSGKAEEHSFWICVRICKQWEPVKGREKLIMLFA